MNASKIQPGDTVVWDCPGITTDGPKVIKVQNIVETDGVILLKDRDGTVIEALSHELSPPKSASRIAGEHSEALGLLREIVWVAGPDYTGDREAALLDAIDNAEAWLEVIDEL